MGKLPSNKSTSGTTWSDQGIPLKGFVLDPGVDPFQPGAWVHPFSLEVDPSLPPPVAAELGPTKKVLTGTPQRIKKVLPHKEGQPRRLVLESGEVVTQAQVRGIYPGGEGDRPSEAFGRLSKRQQRAQKDLWVASTVAGPGGKTAPVKAAESTRPFDNVAFRGVAHTTRETVWDLSKKVPKTPLPTEYPWKEAFQLDIETTGLSRSSVVTEISLYRPGDKAQDVYAIRPGHVDDSGRWVDLERKEIADVVAGRGTSQAEVAPYFVERATPGQQYEIHAQETFDEPAFKKIVKKEGRRAAAGVKQISKGEVHFIDFFADLVQVLKADAETGYARGITAHNVSFDFGKFGEILRAMEKTSLESIEQGGEAMKSKSGRTVTELIDDYMRLLETAPDTPRSRGRAYESGRPLQAAKVIAEQGGDKAGILRAWAGREVGSAARHPVRDTLTLARTVYELVFNRQAAGMASMDVLSAARGVVSHTAHFSFTDNPIEHETAEFIWEIGERVSTGKDLSDKHKMFLGRLESSHKAVASDAYYKNVLEIRANFQGKRLRTGGEGGFEALRFVMQRGLRTVPQRAGEELVEGTVMTTTSKRLPASEQEAFRLLDEWTRQQGLDIDIDNLKQQAMNVEQEHIEKAFHTGLLLEDTIPDLMKKAKADDIPIKMVPKTGERQVVDALSSMGFSFKTLPKGKLAVAGAALAMISLIVATSKTEGDDDAHNDIEGLPEAGLAPEFRKETTDFGSGWQGILEAIMPSGLYLQDSSSIEARLRRFEKTIWQNPGRKAAMEADLKEREKRAQKELGQWSLYDAMPVHRPEMFQGINRFSNVQLYSKKINPSEYNYEFDDADTLVVQRKGFLGRGGAGPKYSIRLAGIDAPEVGGHKGDPLRPIRIAQDQPFGRKSTEEFKRILESQESLTLLFNPEQTTYGRHIGVLFGDQMQNINLQLVKQGLTAYLPYGEAGSSIVSRPEFSAAEQSAHLSKRGMWKEPFWQTYKPMAQATGMSITFNTLTRMDRLARDHYMTEGMLLLWQAQNQGYVDEDVLEEATTTGNRLRYTYGRFGKHNKKRFNRQIQRSRVAGDQSLYNTIPGMQHNEGSAKANRPFYGFGSGAIGRGFSHVASVALGKGATANERSIADLVQLAIRGDKKMAKAREPSAIVRGIKSLYDDLGEVTAPKVTISHLSGAENRAVSEAMSKFSTFDLQAYKPGEGADKLLEKYYRLLKNEAKRAEAQIDPDLQSWANKVLKNPKARTTQPQQYAQAMADQAKTGGVEIPASVPRTTARNTTAAPAQVQQQTLADKQKRIVRTAIQEARSQDGLKQMFDRKRHINRSMQIKKA